MTILKNLFSPNVLVELERHTETSAGIVLPNASAPCIGRVVQLPDDVDDNLFSVEIGDRVLFNPNAVRNFNFDGSDYSMVSWYDIECVVPEGMTVSIGGK